MGAIKRMREDRREWNTEIHSTVTNKGKTEH